MECNYCGTKINKDDVYCPQCGKKVILLKEDEEKSLNSDNFEAENHNKKTATDYLNIIKKKPLVFVFAAVIGLIGIIIIISLSKTSSVNKHPQTTTADQTYLEQTTEYIETTTQEQSLSDTCDEILATGYDGDDYYELVYKITEGYPNAKEEIGVLKNNQWLMPLSDNSPFIINRENGYEESEYFYCGCGCFLMTHVKKPENLRYVTYFLLNVNNKVSFYFSVCPSEFNLQDNSDFSELVIDKRFIGQDTDLNLSVYNVEDGSKRIVPKICYRDADYAYVRHFCILSEGLFYVYKTPYDASEIKRGFYDINGNLIIDADKLNIPNFDFTQEKEQSYFIDGKFTYKAKNNIGTEYQITVDKTGKIIEKNENQ